MFLLMCLPAVAAAGGGALLQDVRYQEQEAHIDLDIRLGIPVQVSAFEADSQVLRLALKPGTEAASGWLSSELRFEEADTLLDTVSIEGRAGKGYTLTIRFSSPVRAQLLPQFEAHQVLLKLARTSDFRSLSRFGRKKGDDPYAINLESRTRSVPTLKDLPRGFATTHTLYVTDFEKDGVLWHRLRLGFFDKVVDAQRTVMALKRYFPNAWIEQVSAREVRFAASFRINPPAYTARQEEPPPGTVAENVQLSIALATPESLSAEPEPEQAAEQVAWPRRDPVRPEPPGRLEAMLQEGHEAFEREDWATAISRYAGVVEAGQEPYRQQALEMLGAARELNDQPAHAKRYYETYLAEYAATDGARRVAQRLAALTAFDAPSNSRKEKAAVLAPDAPAWELGAYFSQFYQRHHLKINDQSRVPINGLFNDLNLTARRQASDLDQEVRLTLSYLLDFSGNDRLSGREVQISSAYWEGFSEPLRSRLRVGRQSNWESGALGRFDGVDYAFQISDRYGFGLTGGYLIDASYHAPGTDRPFFGVSAEYASDSGNLTIKPFYVQQYIDGRTDRQALGVQGQLFTRRAVYFSLLDYDLHHKALNNLTLNGSFTFGRSQLNASYEHRKSPYLTTRNALMGQVLDNLTALEEAVLDLTLEEIAHDRTATSDTLRLGWHSRIGDHWILSADVVASDFSRTESSADVAGLDPHKTLYSSLQVRSTDPFGRGSYSGLMIRLASSETSATTSLYWDNRLTLRNRWFVYPRFRLDRRTFERSDGDQWTFRPSFRVDYRLSRSVRFELETGYEWSSRQLADRSLDIQGLFVRAGYRANL